MQIYDQLVEQLPGFSTLQPGLAQSWDISSDGLTYTFHLRDAQFNNGASVTAEDVKFSLGRMIDPKIDANWAFLYGSVTNFVVVDDKTVQMNMKTPDAGILASLSIPGGSIYSEKAFNALGEKGFQTAPVGTGPFMVKSWTIGQGIDLVRNPHYWRQGQPYLDELNIVTITDDNARLLKVMAGEADVAVSVPASFVAQVKTSSSAHIETFKKMVNWQVFLNNTVKPFNDKLVRQAMNYAAPKDQLNQSVLAGLGTIANSMIAMNGLYWDPTVAPYPYDLAKAKELLAQSSVPNGFSFSVLIEKSNLAAIQGAEILQAAWAQLGITMTITKLDPSVFNDDQGKMNYQAIMWDPPSISSDSPDDSEFAGIFLSDNDAWKSFFTGYKDPQVVGLVNEADSTVDNAKRQQLYSQLQQLVMQDAPWVSLLNAPEIDVVSNKVVAFNSVLTSWSLYGTVCLHQ